MLLLIIFLLIPPVEGIEAVEKLSQVDHPIRYAPQTQRYVHVPEDHPVILVVEYAKEGKAKDVERHDDGNGDGDVSEDCPRNCAIGKEKYDGKQDREHRDHV